MNTAITILPKPPPPQARCAISVRVATKDDVPFIDALQKMHSHMVGFMPTRQIEKYVGDGNVLVAEEGSPHLATASRLRRPGPLPPPQGEGATPLGYIMFRDQYLKRDDVGIVYQLNVLPLKQRHLIGASLVKACFEKAAYGCRLYSCWCAQDIQANWFWESIGFVPLAFRTGSRAKQRIHIFWQRRIRENDDGPPTGTPYWFPSQTGGGAVGEDRIVLPIPVGTHWRDAKPLVLPGLPVAPPAAPEVPKQLPGGQPVCARPEQAGPRMTRSQQAALMRSKSVHLGGAPIGKKAVIRGGRVRYVDIPGFDPATDGPDELIVPTKPKKPRRSGPRQKNDPKYIAAARELRDRYLEEVNGPGGGADRLLPSGAWKYDVSRQLPAAPSTAAPSELKRMPPPHLLKAA